MTTINNSENLIEKVGGIDRAIALEAMLQKHAVPEGWKISIINGMWHRSSVGFTHSDLRTAISEHDEFKVGDLVVHPKFDNKKIYEIIKIKGDLFTVFYDRNSHSFRSDLRHATPSEIKAGHRLEAERHG
ncbi:hypothetical protein ASC84_12425 [Acinetobacter sp. Root1280]|uniref:hypothetical protein n=1 Tax=Acinetobacter sp. Root1280 TaxID=1736444 RepID=UPI0006FAC248|nr:hypothetical protein [Acinetobacter sp. Root1280]KQW88176.1 hypothetical protein ASC84_12425 [Acinetobacter sp. Root1280]